MTGNDHPSLTTIRDHEMRLPDPQMEVDSQLGLPEQFPGDLGGVGRVSGPG